MATIEEYFDDEADECMFASKRQWVRNGVSTEIKSKILMNVKANSKHLSFYVPPMPDGGDCIRAILSTPDVIDGTLSHPGFGVVVGGNPFDPVSDTHKSFSDLSGGDGVGESIMSDTATFTKSIILYLDYEITVDIRRNIIDFARQQGLRVVIRDIVYAKERSANEKPLAFISHDSKDKDSLVRDLAMQMTKLKCSVWYDEYSLSVGDSLRASIEKGLKEAKKCIIVLSPNFFSNTGWGKTEFNSIFTRELIERKNVILPVWHNVGPSEVYSYCPSLADRVGLPSTLGVRTLASKLCLAVKT